MLLCLLLGLLVIEASCGGSAKPPPRGVVETSIGEWRFRRFQQLLDVEIWVPENPAVGYTAGYVRRDADWRGNVESDDIAVAFVTRYQSEKGITRALLQFVRRLDGDFDYNISLQSLGDVRVITVSGQGEVWAMWASDKHIVKIGGRGLQEIPEELVGTYGKSYPSRLESDILDRPLPPEEPSSQPVPDTERDARLIPVQDRTTRGDTISHRDSGAASIGCASSSQNDSLAPLAPSARHAQQKAGV